LQQLLAYEDPLTCLQFAKAHNIKLYLYALKPLIFRKQLPAIKMLIEDVLRLDTLTFDTSLFFWVAAYSDEAMLLYGVVA